MNAWKKLVAGLAAGAACAGPAAAGDFTWQGGNDPTNWSLPSNWGGTAPVDGDALYFDGGSGLVNTNDFAAGTRFNGLTFNAGAGAFTLDGNAINLGSSLTNNSASLQTVNLNLTLLQNTVFNTAAGNLALGGGVAGDAFGLTKVGAGTLTLSGANTFGGAVQVSGGTLLLNNAAVTSTGNVVDYIGRNAGESATLRLQGSSVLQRNQNNLIAGSAAGSTGLFYMEGGIFTNAGLTAIGDGGVGVLVQTAGDIKNRGEFDVGFTTAGGYGYYQMSGGTLTNNNWLQASRVGLGVIYQEGGAIHITASGVIVGSVGGANCTGVLYQTAGVLTTPFVQLTRTANARGELTVAGTARLAISGNLELNTLAGTNIVNLLGGVLRANTVTKKTVGGLSILNFDGGTLQAGAAGNLIATATNAPDYVNIYGGGATIDDGGFAVNVSQNLLAPPGIGVTSLDLGVPSLGGYVGAPYVSISGGGGTGATAVALFDTNTGSVTGLLVTSAGFNYTSTPTVTLYGGGHANFTVPTVVAGVNGSGGLTKLGTGTLTLSGTNTYTGPTLIGAGTLSVAGSSALPGWATPGNCAVSNGAALAVGNAFSDADVATLLGTGNFAAGSSLGFDTTAGNRTNDTIIADLPAGMMGLVKVGANTLVLTAANTYSGTTRISAGTLTVASIGSANGWAGPLGGPTDAAGGTIHLGAAGVVGTLGYTGPGETSDRVLDLAGTTGGGTIAQVGSGLLKFTSDLTATGNGVKTLTLQGTGNGEISGVIPNSTTNTSVTKAGTGTWFLTGTNSFGGELNISAGILNVAGLNNYGVNGPLGNRAQSDEWPTLTIIGLHFSGGTLQFTGTGAQFTDRQIRIKNGTAGGIIDASGQTPADTLNFTYSNANTNFFDTAGTRTLTLTGSNTGNNLFALNIQDQAAGTRTTLAKTGAGTWDITNPHNSDAFNAVGGQFGGYGGGTTIAGGTLGFASNALGGGVIDFTGSATLRWDAGNGMDVSSGTGSGAARSLKIEDGVTATFDLGANDVTLAGSFAVGTLKTGAVVKQGAGTMTLAASNTYVGDTTVGAGTMVVAHAFALGGSALNYSSGGGTLVFGGGSAAYQLGGLKGDGNLALTNLAGAGVALTVSNTADMAYSGALDDAGLAGSLTKSGAGRLTLSGTNVYGGGTFIRAGTLLVASDLTLGTGGGGLTFTNGGTLQTSADLTLNNRAVTLQTGGGVFSTDAGTTLAATNIVSGAGGLTKSGAGTLTLSGANTYSGATLVKAGTLILAGNRTAVAGAITVGADANPAAVYVQNGSFSLAGNTFIVGTGAAGTNAVVHHSAGDLSFSGGNQLLLGNGVVGNVGIYNLTGGGLACASVANRGVLLGVNTGTTGIFNLGGGALNLPGLATLEIARSENTASSSATGIFNQTGGVATISHVCMGGAAAVNNANNVGILYLAGGTFTATNFDYLSVGSNSTSTITIAGSADVTLPAFPTVRGSGATATLIFDGGTLRPYAATNAYLSGLTHAWLTTNGANFDVASGRDITVAQALENAAPQAGVLTKSGAGALTLSGANTYSGGTIVSNGTLRLAASGAIGNSRLIHLASPGSTVDVTAVSGGFHLLAGQQLKGTGTLQGGLIMDPGAQLDPGNSLGTLNVSGNLTLATGTTNYFDLVAPNGGDRVEVGGTLDVGGIQFTDFVFAPDFGVGASVQTYTLFRSGGAVAGALGPVTNGTVNAQSAYLHVGGAASDELQLTVIPEPATLGLLGLWAAALLWRRRRD